MMRKTSRTQSPAPAATKPPRGTDAWAGLNERTVTIPQMRHTNTPYVLYRVFFPDTSKSKQQAATGPAPVDRVRELSHGENPEEGEVFEVAVNLRPVAGQPLMNMTVQRMPGYRKSFTFAKATSPDGAQGLPEHIKVPKKEKLEFLERHFLINKAKGHQIVKLAVGQVPFHIEDAEFKAAIEHVTGSRRVYLVESMMHHSGQGRNGFRFVFVHSDDADMIIRKLNRLCIFTRTEMCVFDYNFVLSPLMWCQNLAHIMDVEEPGFRPLLPMTMCRAIKRE